MVIKTQASPGLDGAMRHGKIPRRAKARGKDNAAGEPSGTAKEKSVQDAERSRAPDEIGETR